MASPLHEKPLLVGCAMLVCVALAILEATLSDQLTAMWIVFAILASFFAVVNLSQAARRRGGRR